MYKFIYSNKYVRSYDSIRDLYNNELFTIAINLRYDLFFFCLREYNIYDLLDDEGLKIGAKRNKLFAYDEIDLLNDDELFTVLEKCLNEEVKIRFEQL